MSSPRSCRRKRFPTPCRRAKAFHRHTADARGEVHAETSVAHLHLRYLLRHPAVYMAQWLSLNANGRTVDNQAQVTVFGVPWVRLSEAITRIAAFPP